jgi:hypothetical protein
MNVGRANVGRDRRLRVARAVFRGVPVDDPSDAALAVVRAGKVLRRHRRSKGRPFGRDFVLVATAGVGLIAVPGFSLFGKLAMIAVAAAFLIVLEIGLDWLATLRLDNARKAEQANVAIVLDEIAAKYRTLPAPGQSRRALPAPSTTEREPGTYSPTGLRVA